MLIILLELFYFFAFLCSVQVYYENGLYDVQVWFWGLFFFGIICLSVLHMQFKTAHNKIVFDLRSELHLASLSMFANRDQFERLTRNNLSFGIRVPGEN